MPSTPRTHTDGMERREFIKKTGAGVLAAGFPAIISGQTVTNAVKVGLVGAGGRGTGAAAQALTADGAAELTAIADIDEAIVERTATRLQRQREVRRAGQDRQRLLRPRRLRQGDQQRRRRSPARDPAGIPAAAPDRGGEREQARVLREAVRHRFAGRARGDGGAEAGADEEPRARRRLLLALQQHDPGGGAARAQRRARPARRALLDLLHQPGEADAARERAPRRHERHRVADPQLVQLHLAVRRQPGGAGRPQRGQDHVVA